MGTLWHGIYLRNGRQRKGVIYFLAATILALSAAPSVSQTTREPVRLHFSKGNTAVARGLVGGEATDSYVVYAKAGQKLTIRALSDLKRTQVYVTPMKGDISLKEEQQRSDLTQWRGKVTHTGDYLVEINVYPGGEEYRLEVTVK